MAAGKQIGLVTPTVILLTYIIISVNTIQADTSIVVISELSLNVLLVVQWHVKKIFVVT